MKAKLSKQVLDKAIERIRGQGPQPKSPSPCSVSKTGEIKLCAAAAVASAGIEMASGVEARETFEKDLAKQQDRSLVRKIYETFGWDDKGEGHETGT